MHGWAWDLVLASWIAWAALWLVMAAFVKRTVERPASGWRLAVGVVAVAMAVVLRTQTRPGAAQLRWERSSALDVAVAALVVGGLAFTAWARVVLGGNWSGGVVLKEHHELVQTGPYRVVRHPIYTGLIAMVLGTALFYGEPLVAGVAVAVAVVLYAKSQREERFMTEHFPDVYPAYRARTKAIIPFVL